MQPAAGPLEGVLPGEQPPLRLALLGESTAAGTGSPTHETSMAGHLARELRARSGQEVQWRVLGRNGATARRVARQLVPRLTAEWPPSHLVVLVGMNDVQRTWRLRTWERHLTALLTEAGRRCPGATVVVSGLPDVRTVPALARPLVPIFAARATRMGQVTKTVTHALGVRYVPVEHIELTDSFFAADRMHPSPEGYRQWAAELAPVLTDTARDD